MDSDFFDKISKGEAYEFLKNYLEKAREGFEELIPQLVNYGINVDYSFTSFPEVANWIIEKINIIPLNEDKALPSWILETEQYKSGLYNFDNPSAILIFRLSYYLGACFIKYDDRLGWDIGNENYANKNMPVITGFNKDMQLPTIVVTRNLIRGVLEGREPQIIKSALERWLSYL